MRNVAVFAFIFAVLLGAMAAVHWPDKSKLADETVKLLVTAFGVLAGVYLGADIARRENTKREVANLIALLKQVNFELTQEIGTLRTLERGPSTRDLDPQRIVIAAREEPLGSLNTLALLLKDALLATHAPESIGKIIHYKTNIDWTWGNVNKYDGVVGVRNLNLYFVHVRSVQSTIQVVLERLSEKLDKIAYEKKLDRIFQHRLAGEKKYFLGSSSLDFSFSPDE